jgi:uncharacterized protein with FMN-binding domain
MLLFFLILACAKEPAVTVGKIDHQRLVDGVYEGSYRNGPVKAKVKVSIEDQKIANINLIQHTTWKGKVAEQIIPNRIKENQSTNVDAVTGATISSKTIMNAVQNAIDDAYK